MNWKQTQGNSIIFSLQNIRSENLKCVGIQDLILNARAMAGVWTSAGNLLPGGAAEGAMGVTGDLGG